MTVRILCAQASEEDLKQIAAALPDYNVVAARNAYEAIRQTNTAGPFDAYVLDLWLPDLDGVRLCRDIRKADPGVPIVLCSSTDRDGDADRATRAGANAYLVRPITASDLQSRIRALLDAVEVRKMSAIAAEERAVTEELVEQAKRLQDRSRLTQERVRAALERVTRAKARSVFISKAGTASEFERVWPQLFDEKFCAMWSPNGSEPDKPRHNGAKLEGWRFDRAVDGWRWRYADPSQAAAPKDGERAFATLLECVKDATRNGYVPDAQRHQPG